MTEHTYKVEGMHCASCEILIENNSVFGCCKPVKIIHQDNNEYDAVECDYI